MCRAASKSFFNKDCWHIELRAHIIIEGILNKDKYLTDDCLERGATLIHANADLPNVFSTFAEFYTPGQKLTSDSIMSIYCKELHRDLPEISAIQTKVYRMLKCHLSIINHSSITQFDDISLSNHDFDRVAGPDFHNVSGTESRPDLSLQTDFNDTYYSVFSQAQRQVYRVTERSLGRLRSDRANSCPDIVQQLNRDFDHFSNSNWRYTTAHE